MASGILNDDVDRILMRVRPEVLVMFSRLSDGEYHPSRDSADDVCDALGLAVELGAVDEWFDAAQTALLQADALSVVSPFSVSVLAPGTRAPCDGFPNDPRARAKARAADRARSLADHASSLAFFETVEDGEDREDATLASDAMNAPPTSNKTNLRLNAAAAMMTM